MKLVGVTQARNERFASWVAALCALVLAPGALAQDAYPSKPIRFVLPYTTGGGSDRLTRAVADEMGKRLGQPVLVDSRPGANTMIAAEIVARARNDGYTLLYLGWTTITTNLVTYKNITAIVAAMALKRVRDVLEGDQIPTTISPEAFTELIRRDISTWGPVIRANNLVQ